MKNLTNLLDRYENQIYDLEGESPNTNDLEYRLYEILYPMDDERKIEALQAIVSHIDNMPFEVNMFLRKMRNEYKEKRIELLKNGKATPATGKKKKKGKGGNPNPVPNEKTGELKAGGEKNTPIKKAVIEKAKEIYHEVAVKGMKGRNHFQTPSGAASKKLYGHRDLLSEFPEVNKRTIRDWVERAWKKGEI